MNALALYGRYVSASLRAQAQYPAATLMLTVGHCAATAIEILGVFALFDRFGPVGGWTLTYQQDRPPRVEESEGGVKLSPAQGSIFGARSASLATSQISERSSFTVSIGRRFK